MFLRPCLSRQAQWTTHVLRSRGLGFTFCHPVSCFRKTAAAYFIYWYVSISSSRVGSHGVAEAPATRMPLTRLQQPSQVSIRVDRGYINLSASCVAARPSEAIMAVRPNTHTHTYIRTRWLVRRQRRMYVYTLRRGSSLLRRWLLVVMNRKVPQGTSTSYVSLLFPRNGVAQNACRIFDHPTKGFNSFVFPCCLWCIDYLLSATEYHRILLYIVAVMTYLNIRFIPSYSRQ